jgi:hypothetical protein
MIKPHLHGDSILLLKGVWLNMDEDNFAKWERILVRLAGLILLVILIVKVIAKDAGFSLP